MAVGRGAGIAAVAAGLLGFVAIVDGQQGADALDALGEAEVRRLEAAIAESFPAASDWRLTVAEVGFLRNELDWRVHVDLPAGAISGRTGLHPRFDCVRQRKTGLWSCGDRWHMRLQVERQPSAAPACRSPLVGLDASGVSDEQLILDAVDFFSETRTANAALAAADSCRSVDHRVLCSMSGVGGGRQIRPGGPQPAYEARFVLGASSRLVVGFDRDCDGVGPCLIEIVGCIRVASD